MPRRAKTTQDADDAMEGVLSEQSASGADRVRRSNSRGNVVADRRLSREGGGQFTRQRQRTKSLNRGRDRAESDRHLHLHDKLENPRVPMAKRSQSLGQRMTSAVSTTPRQRKMAPPPKLLLYHVSSPEPRARWVFNLSKHTNVVNNGPPPDTVTSTIDKKRPSLGGLVWVNATLGNHCCLQKGTKSKTVTPVPASVLDGWLNGQTGFWWIGALKEGHRSLWDSHVVMSWAMVFIPSSPEVRERERNRVHSSTQITLVLFCQCRAVGTSLLRARRTAFENKLPSQNLRLPFSVEVTCCGTDCVLLLLLYDISLFCCFEHEMRRRYSNVTLNTSILYDLKKRTNRFYIIVMDREGLVRSCSALNAG